MIKNIERFNFCSLVKKRIYFFLMFLILLIFSSCDYYEDNYKKLQKDLNVLKKAVGNESQKSFKICKTISEKEVNFKKKCFFECESGYKGFITVERSNSCPARFAESEKDNLEQFYKGYNVAP